MRRTATILVVVAPMITFSCGVALAAYEVSITGTIGEDIISGTRQAEHISPASVATISSTVTAVRTT
jgi:hypothetical protein